MIKFNFVNSKKYKVRKIYGSVVYAKKLETKCPPRSYYLIT